MKQTCFLFLSVLLAFFPKIASAEDVELQPVDGRSPTERAFMLGIGSTNQLDTYLSPMSYKGTQLSFLARSERMTHLASRHVSFQNTFHAAFTSADNPAGTASCLGGRLAYDAGWHYHFSPLPHLDLKGGALVGADLGFLYNDHGGNNPAQGHFSIDLSLSAGAAYSFRLRKLPLRVGYQADMPMVGMMFSPEFGESYYEISQRGVGHNLLCAHPGNALCFRQTLMLDFHLKRITLRVGYLCDVRQSHAHSLKYRDASHSFMFGIARHFQLMKRVKNEK